MSHFLHESKTGWRNLAAATVGIGFGVSSYAAIASLFRHAIELDRGWSKTAIAGALIAQPLSALIMPFAGRLIDRHGVRIVSFLSVLAAAASFLWLARIESLAQFYLASMGVEILGVCTAPIAYTRLVALQYRRSRGLALAIAQFGIALMGAILPLIIGFTIVSYGWRSSYLLFAAMILLGGLLAQLLMQPGDLKKTEAKATGMTASEALRSTAFWTLGVAILLVSMAGFGFVTQFQALILDRGVTADHTMWMLSLVALSVMLSRLAMGPLLDIAHPTRAAAAMMAIAAVGGVVLLIPAGGLITTILGVIMISFSVGAELDIMSFFVARFFGVRHYSQIYGLLSILFRLGIALGGVSYSAIRDNSGSFGGALFMASLLLAGSAGIFLLLGRQKSFSEAE